MKLTTKFKNGRIIVTKYIIVPAVKTEPCRRLTDKEMYSLPFWLPVMFTLSEHRKN